MPGEYRTSPCGVLRERASERKYNNNTLLDVQVNGDYFTTQPLAAVDVAFSKYEEVAAATAESEVQGQSDPRREAAGGRDGRGGEGGFRPTAYLRQWALGEVVTAVCSSRRLAIRLLDEEPGPRLDDAGLPKVFTLLAERVGG